MVQQIIANRQGRVVEITPPLEGRAGGEAGEEGFPHRGDTAYLHATGYMQSKKEFDMAGEAVLYNLWRLHGEYYDLSEFISQHPGGEYFIKQTIGTDVTVAVECHHIKYTTEQLLLIIKPYKIDLSLEENDEIAAAADRVSKVYKQPFTFNKGDFYDVFKSRVRDFLAAKGNPSGNPTTAMKLTMAAQVAQWGTSATLAAVTGKPLFAVLAGLCMNGMWGTGHEALHQGENLGAFRHAMDVTGMSSDEASTTHALSHHLYPNTHLDWEVFAFLPGTVAWTTAEKSETSKILTETKLWPVAFTLMPLFELASRPINMLFGTRPKKLPDLAPFMTLAGFMAASKGGPWQGFKQWITMQMTFQALFPLIGLAVHHSHDEEGVPRAWHEGEPDPEMDFGLHQCKATSDHSVDLGIYPAMTLYGCLHNHQVHHLLPGKL